MKAIELLRKQKEAVQPLIVDEDEFIEDILKKLFDFRTYQIIYVMDKNKKLCGYINTNSLIKHYASEHIITSAGETSAGEILDYVTSKHAKDIMKKHIFYCYEDENINDIFINMMKEKHPYIIAVLNRNDQYIGFLDLLYMIREIINQNGS